MNQPSPVRRKVADGEMSIAQDARRMRVGRGFRMGEGGDTTDSLRKALANLLIEAYRQMNAVARINDSEQTRNAVSEVNGIIAHYKDVAAQPAKRKGGDEPAPEPEPEASAS